MIYKDNMYSVNMFSFFKNEFYFGSIRPYLYVYFKCPNQTLIEQLHKEHLRTQF